MNTRDQADFGGQGPNLLRGAPVGTNPFVENTAAYFRRNHVFIAGGDLGRAEGFGSFGPFGVFGQYDVAQILEFGVALIAIRAVGDDAGNLSFDAQADTLREIGITPGGDVFRFGLAELGAHLFLDADHILDRVVGQAQRLDHRLFVHFVRARTRP